MTDPTKNPTDDSSPSNIQWLIDSGADLTGATLGATAGVILAGPAGALGGAAAGAAAGAAIASAFKRVGAELKTRFLGKRETKRIGATVVYAAEKISKNLSDGKQIRQDSFFAQNNDTSDAQEILEGVILAAQREHEEKKLHYMGNMYANIAFSPEITKAHANFLIKLAAQLTYRQLCLLQLIRNAPTLQLRPQDYRAHGSFSIDLRTILHEIYDLYQNTLINCSNIALISMTDITPSLLQIQGSGADLFNLMELWTIPPSDFESTIKVLQ